MLIPCHSNGPVASGKLFYGLLAINIVRYYLGFISTMTTNKLAPAILAFIQLLTASQAIPDHFFRPTEKAFF